MRKNKFIEYLDFILLIPIFYGFITTAPSFVSTLNLFDSTPSLFFSTMPLMVFAYGSTLVGLILMSRSTLLRKRVL